MNKYLKLVTILLVLALFVITVIAPIKSALTATMQYSTSTGSINFVMPPGLDVDIQIKPETINLASNGIFTVFVEFLAEVHGGYPPGSDILAGQKMLMKGEVQDIDVLPGEESTICIGASISNGSEEMLIRGFDTVRVVYGDNQIIPAP